MSRRHPDQVVVAVDPGRCDGHGICALRCPERISLDRWGFAVVDSEPLSDPAGQRRARAAAAACPTGALEVLTVHTGAMSAAGSRLG